MILMYANHQLTKIDETNKSLLADAIWIDLITPTRKEEKLIEEFLNIDVPTKKEMQEIEPSSRLYTDDDDLFMTATMVAQSGMPDLTTDPVTFILMQNKLVTVRYIEPQVFKSFVIRLSKLKTKDDDAKKIFVGLLEMTTDRLADILENISHDFDKISYKIFHSEHKNNDKINYKSLLKSIGANGDLTTRVRESLVSFLRLTSFFEQAMGQKIDSE